MITMESTKKLQAMISAVSTMLLKGLHGATSKASCGGARRKQLENGAQQAQHGRVYSRSRNTCLFF